MSFLKSIIEDLTEMPRFCSVDILLIGGAFRKLTMLSVSLASFSCGTELEVPGQILWSKLGWKSSEIFLQA